jgi:hypothetical protein
MTPLRMANNVVVAAKEDPCIQRLSSRLCNGAGGMDHPGALAAPPHVRSRSKLKLDRDVAKVIII